MSFWLLSLSEVTLLDDLSHFEVKLIHFVVADSTVEALLTGETDKEIVTDTNKQTYLTWFVTSITLVSTSC